MTASESDPPVVFGAPPAGVVCHERRAAYAVIADADGRVAAVRALAGGRACCWLPGGGALAGETPEDTVVREVREELGRVALPVARIGEAVEYFYAGGEGRWYEMTATFVRAELDGEPLGAGEHELCWLDPGTEGDAFFHACHAWAASRGRSGPRPRSRPEPR